MSDLLIWSVFAICLLVSFVLSGLEAGVFALSRLRIRQQMRAGRKSAALLHHYLENPENFLWTVLVGNTIANFYILGCIVVWLHHVLKSHRGSFILIYSVVVFLFYAFFDLLPKMLFRQYPNRLCIALARPFRFLNLLLRPIVAVVEWFSNLMLKWRGGKVFRGVLFGNREELLLMMQESAQTLTSDERVMINRVLELQRMTVRQTMRPMSQVQAASAETPLREILQMAREHNISRVPVWEGAGGSRRVAGLINVDALLFNPETDVEAPALEYIQPAVFVEEDMRMEVVLRQMQRAGQRTAIVLGRNRQEMGIVTLQDVLRGIFGEVSL